MTIIIIRSETIKGKEHSSQMESQCKGAFRGRDVSVGRLGRHCGNLKFRNDWKRMNKGEGRDVVVGGLRVRS